MKILRETITNWINQLTYKNFKKALQGDFLKGTATLGSVSVLSQIVSFLASMVLTRIYSPKDFGIQAIFASILTQLSVLASFRYEWAILLPKRDKDAINLLFLCLFFSIGVSGTTLAVIALWGSSLAQIGNIEEVEPFLLIIPPAILMTGFYQSLNYLFIRERNFNEIAKTRIAQSLSTNFSQITLGWVIAGPIGLLIGTALNSSIGAIRLLLKTSKTYLEEVKSISIKEVIKISVKYYKFPTFSLWSSFINSAGLIAPILMLSHFYTTSDIGSFSFARRMIAIPVSVIGTSVFQVFLPDATSLISKNPKKLKKQYLNIAKILLYIAFLIGFILWFSPYIFPLLFGNRWYESGLIVRCMIPFFISSFVVSSLSILDWLNRQKWMFAWNMVRFLSVVIGFYITGYYKASLFISILTFSCLTTALYVCLFILNLIAINRINVSEPIGR